MKRGRITRALTRGLLRLESRLAAARRTQTLLLSQHQRLDSLKHGQRDLIDLLLRSGAMEGPHRPSRPTPVPFTSRVATAVRSYINRYRWVL